MPPQEPPKRIEPIEGVESQKPLRVEPSETGEEGPSKVKFEEAMEKADPSKVEQRPIEPKPEKIAEEATGIKENPLEMAAKASQKTTEKAPITPEELMTQVKKIKNGFERPRAVLLRANDVLPADAFEKLPEEMVAELSGGIEHMDRSLREASKLTTGVEVGSAIDTEKPPLVRYLGYLTESDKRLSTFISDLSALDLQKTRLSPSIMMAIQIKMGFIQQELEFFTATLNKALESVKTIFNVQI